MQLELPAYFFERLQATITQGIEDGLTNAFFTERMRNFDSAFQKLWNEKAKSHADAVEKHGTGVEA